MRRYFAHRSFKKSRFHVNSVAHMSERQGFYWWELDLMHHVLRGLEKAGLVWGLWAPPATAYRKRTLLVQPATGRDVTEDMEAFAGRFLSVANGVDGFILKLRSPSCGLGGVKVYKDAHSRFAGRSEPGLFAGAVLARYGGRAVEDEGRLRNRRIREHFLTKLFALARLREIGAGARMRDLVRFQSMYKFVLLGYGEKHLRGLGRIVANAERRLVAEVFARYRTGFMAALERR